MEHFLKNMTADAFNEKYPVGTRFKYFSVLGIPDSVEVTTRTPAWPLGHGDVVVSLTGRAGGFHIKHMKFVAFPEKALPRLTIFDIESLKALCVRIISHHPLTDNHINGVAVDNAALGEWVKTITPELVLRLVNQVNLSPEKQS